MPRFKDFTIEELEFLISSITLSGKGDKIWQPDPVTDFVEYQLLSELKEELERRNE